MREKFGIGKRLGDMLGVNEICGTEDSLTARGKRELTICGCRGILLYSTEKIRLLMHGFVLVICGQDMYCASYYNGAVRVDGEIRSIEFEGDK